MTLSKVDNIVLTAGGRLEATENEKYRLSEDTADLEKATTFIVRLQEANVHTKCGDNLRARKFHSNMQEILIRY